MYTDIILTSWWYYLCLSLYLFIINNDNNISNYSDNNRWLLLSSAIGYGTILISYYPSGSGEDFILRKSSVTGAKAKEGALLSKGAILCASHSFPPTHQKTSLEVTRTRSIWILHYNEATNSPPSVPPDHVTEPATFHLHIRFSCSAGGLPIQPPTVRDSRGTWRRQPWENYNRLLEVRQRRTRVAVRNSYNRSHEYY